MLSKGRYKLHLYGIHTIHIDKNMTSLNCDLLYIGKAECIPFSGMTT